VQLIGLNCCDDPKDPRVRKRCDARIAIAELLLQNLPVMLAEQGRGNRVDDRRKGKIVRRFDVGNRSCSWMRDLAQAVPLAHLGRVEGFLHSAKVTNGDVVCFHFCHPVLTKILHKNSSQNGAQFILVGGS